MMLPFSERAVLTDPAAVSGQLAFCGVPTDAFQPLRRRRPADEYFTTLNAVVLAGILNDKGHYHARKTDRRLGEVELAQPPGNGVSRYNRAVLAVRQRFILPVCTE
jgi:hypothetical protein